MRATVTKVNTLKPDERRFVCYVGRRHAGWPETKWANTGRLSCPGAFRDSLLAMPKKQLDFLLESLWRESQNGTKPLGCWCLDWDGIGPTPRCHAAVWAELLNERYRPDDTTWALTLPQPFAWSVTAGDLTWWKSNWGTNLIGLVYVHAAMETKTADEWKRKAATWPGLSTPPWPSLVHGAILGTARLVACAGRGTYRLPPKKEDRELVRRAIAESAATSGEVVWVFADPSPLPRPIGVSRLDQGDVALWLPPAEAVIEAYHVATEY